MRGRAGEARRVVRPGGLVGFSFWGSPKRLGLLPYFAALLELSPPGHVDATINQGDTGRPGVAEQMLADAGLQFVDRGTAQVINEWPDLDLAVRALAASGPSWPALQQSATTGSPRRCARRSARCTPKVSASGSSPSSAGSSEGSPAPAHCPDGQAATIRLPFSAPPNTMKVFFRNRSPRVTAARRDTHP